MIKLNINGYARHGKDTVADMFVQFHGFRKTDASMLYARDIRQMGVIEGYHSDRECYDDRINHRKEWFDFITDATKNEPDLYVKEVLRDGDIYVGQRNLKQYYQTKHLFDATIWVDSSNRGLKREAKESCELNPLIEHTFYIDNSKSIYETGKQIDSIMNLLINRKNIQNDAL